MTRLSSVKNSDFRKFLKHNGCTFKSQNKHLKYSKAGLLRPIIFRAKGNIPLLHIKTNLKNLGLTLDDLEEFLNSKKK